MSAIKDNKDNLEVIRQKWWFLFFYCFSMQQLPASPIYVVLVSQSLRYGRVFSHYRKFIHRSKLLINELLTRGHCKSGPIMAKFHHNIVDYYDQTSLYQNFCWICFVPVTFMFLLFNILISNEAGVASWTGVDHSSGALGLNSPMEV